MIVVYILISIIAGAYILVYSIALHKALLNWIPYRWLVNSVIYPYHRFRLSRKSEDDKIMIYTNWIMNPRWFNEYWFGRMLTKYLENYIDSNVKL